MNPSEPNPDRERLDEATSRRLAKLRTVPFDTSKLRQAVEAEVPPHPQPAARPERRRLFSLKPMRAAAASLLVLGLIIALVISSSSGPVLASAERLARIHDEASSGAGHSTPVDSFDSAKAALAAKWPGGPTVPELPRDEVMSCCIHMMGRKKTACVCFRADGVPVTLAVAVAADVKLPASETLTAGGITYHVQSHAGINMVMTERDGRWVCLMARLPLRRLAELAGTLRF